MRRSDWLTPPLALEKFSTSAASSASEATRRTHNSVRQRLTSLHSKSTRGVDADASCEWGVSLRKRRKAPEVISRAYTSLIARAHAHTGCSVRTQITWTWLCTRGKKRYKYCSFSHTNRSFRVLGHQCVVTMGNCLIWISLCMFFFPLIETVTYTCHYMTDRLERFDLKTSKLDLLKKKRHLHLGCPWGKLIDTKF